MLLFYKFDIPLVNLIPQEQERFDVITMTLIILQRG